MRSIQASRPALLVGIVMMVVVLAGCGKKESDPAMMYDAAPAHEKDDGGHSD